MKDRKGTSYLEVIITMVIILIAFLGLFQAFAFGRIYVERTGVHRQAIAAVQKELELIQNVSFEAGGKSINQLNLPPYPKKEILSGSREVGAEIRAEISPPLAEGGLKYQNVNVIIVYEDGDQLDSTRVSTKIYLQS